MQRLRHSALIVLLVVTAFGVIGIAQRQSPPRLVVTNYTGALVTVSSLIETRWQPRARLRPGESIAIDRVANGDRFKADWPGGSDEKVVTLSYDRAYGGLQDTWVVKGGRDGGRGVDAAMVKLHSR